MKHAAPEKRWDRVGVAVSGLCLVHCIGGALLPGLFAAGGLHLVSDEALHAGLLLVVLPVAAFALARGVKRHGDRRAAALGVAGIACLCLGLAAHGGSGWLETAFTVVGSALLVAGHAWNARLLARAVVAHCCA